MSNSKLFENPEYEELQLNLNVYLMAQRYADEHECPNCGFKGGLVVSQSDCDKYECLNCGHRGSFDQEIVDRNDVDRSSDLRVEMMWRVSGCHRTQKKSEKKYTIRTAVNGNKNTR